MDPAPALVAVIVDGVDVSGTAIYGMVFLGDAANTLKLVSIALVIIGIVGLPLSGASH